VTILGGPANLDNVTVTFAPSSATAWELTERVGNIWIARSAAPLTGLLLAEATGFAPANANVVAADFAPDRTASVTLTLAVQQFPNAGTLRGVVTSTATGNPPVANATVIAVAANGTSVTGVTNALGHYEIQNLPPGTYTVFVTATGFAMAERSGVVLAANAATTENFQLTPDDSAYEYTLVVTVNGGPARANVSVTLGGTAITAGSGNTWILRGEEPMTGQVLATAAGFVPAFATVAAADYQPNNVAAVALTLNPIEITDPTTGGIDGHVRGTGGALLPGATVTIVSSAGATITRTTNAQG